LAADPVTPWQYSTNQWRQLRASLRLIDSLCLSFLKLQGHHIYPTAGQVCSLALQEAVTLLRGQSSTFKVTDDRAFAPACHLPARYRTWLVSHSSTAPMYPPRRFFLPQPPPSPCPTQWNVPYSLFPCGPYQIVALALPVSISAPVSFVAPS
jgi:hypothetical protein